MKALLLTDYRQLELKEVDDPVVGPDDVLLDVMACGICGSDIHGYDGSSGRRIPPLIMGHEAAGIVKAIGSAVTNFAVGDRVIMDSTISCGDCFFCGRGDVNLCDNRQVLGVSCDAYRRHGAFAELLSVPARICYAIPDELAFEHAALIEAVSIAVHAVARTPIRSGGSVVVVGTGMIGLLVVQAAKVAGAGSVIAIDLDKHRLELAQELGADVAINASADDITERVQKLTEGRGADVAFEVVGATPTINTAIHSVRRGGAVTLIGNLAPTVELPLQSVVTREITLAGSCASAGEYPRCIELMSSGQIRVEPLITAITDLEQAAGWFDRLYAGDGKSMKVVVCPSKPTA